MFGKQRLERMEERNRKRDQLTREYPSLSNSEIIDLLVTSNWDLAMARATIAIAQVSEMSVSNYLAMLEQH